MSTFEDCLTDEIEVALFSNDSLAVTAFLYACKEEMVRACADQINAVRSASAAASVSSSGRTSSLSRPTSDSEAFQQAAARRVQQQVTEMMTLVDDELLDRDTNDNGTTEPRPTPLEDPPIPSDPSVPREHSGTSLYHSLWSKRVCILKRLLQATREDMTHVKRARQVHSRNNLTSTLPLSSSTAALPSASSTSLTLFNHSNFNAPASTIPPLLRWGILSLFPLIDSVSKTDPSVKSQTIQILVNILQSSPPLSLANESEETIDQMMKLIQPSTLNSHEKNDSTIQSNGAIISAQIGLSLQRGSLRHILAALLPLLDESTMSGLQLDVQPYLHSLIEYQQNVRLLSILTEDAYIGNFHHHPITVRTRTNPSTYASQLSQSPDSTASKWLMQPLSSIIPYFASLATDGTFHYVHSLNALMKIGTGLNGTLQGHIYAVQPFCGGDIYTGWLAAVNGWLYYRTNEPNQPLTYLATILDPDTLRIVGQLQCSQEQISILQQSMNLSCTDELRWYHMITDGRLLYFLREVSSERQQYCFTVFDPAHAVHSENNSTQYQIFSSISHEIILPNGFTPFPSGTRRSRGLEELVCPYHYYVDQKIDAKDSINKWCPAEVVQVTPSRILVHYEGWNAKWDEWFDFEKDSYRLAKRGEYTSADGNLSKEERNRKSDATPEWSFQPTHARLLPTTTIMPSSATGMDLENTTTDGDESWTSHSALCCEKLESVFGSPAAAQPFLLRTSRREYCVYLSRMIQVDTTTNEICYLRRRVPEVPGRSSMNLEDILIYTTGKQFIFALPPRMTNKGKTEASQLRVFTVETTAPVAHRPGIYEPAPLMDMMTVGLIPSSTSPSSLVLAHCTVDRPLLAMSAKSAPISGPSTPAHLLHSQVSSICYDHINDLLWTYHSAQSRLARFKNHGPKTNSIAIPQKSIMIEEKELEEKEVKQEDDLEEETQTTQVVATTAEMPKSDGWSIIEQVLSHLTSTNTPTHTKSSSSSLVSASPSPIFSPYCVDVHPTTFQALFTLLQTSFTTFHSLISSSADLPSSHILSILCHTLKLVSFNFSQLDEYVRVAPNSDLQTVFQLLPKYAAILKELASYRLPEKASNLIDPNLLVKLHVSSHQCLMAALPYVFSSPGAFSSMLIHRLEQPATIPSNTASTIVSSSIYVTTQRDHFIDSLLESSASSSQHLIGLFHSASQTEVSNLLIAGLTAVHQQTRQFIQLLVQNHKQIADERAANEFQPFLFDEVHPAITSTKPPLLTSAMRLLLRSQRYFFALVDTELSSSNHHSSSSTWFSILQLYVEQVYSLSASLLSFAYDSSVELGFSRSAITFRSALNDELQSTMIGILIPTVSTFMGALALQGSLSSPVRSRLAGVGQSELQHVLNAFDRWNSLCGSGSHTLVGAPINRQTIPTSPGSGQSFSGITASSAGSIVASNLEFHHFVLETPHLPYVHETLDRTIAVTGAVGLLIQFDERCASRNSNETLKLSQTSPAWQLLCSGPSQSMMLAANTSGTHSSRHSLITSKWPSHLIRRPGDSLHLFWQVERKEKDREKEAEKDHRAPCEYGFKLTIHGFVPHPSPRMQLTSTATIPHSTTKRIPWCLDCELGLSTMLGLLAAPSDLTHNHPTELANPSHAVHPLSPIATLFAESIQPPSTSTKNLIGSTSVSLPSSTSTSSLSEIIDADVPELTEDAIDSMVDMEVVAMGLKSSQKATYQLTKEETLLADLLDQEVAASTGLISLPTSPDRNNQSMSSNKTPSPPLSQARILIDWMIARLSGRPAMNPSMKRLMQPCQAKLLGMLLWHAQLLTPAADLLTLIQEEGPNDLLTPSLTPAGSPTLGPISPPHGLSASGLPSSPSLTSSVSQIRRRAMTPQQTVLFNQLRPIWMNVYKIEQWILNQAQINNKFTLFLDESKVTLITDEEMNEIIGDQSNRSTDISNPDILAELFIIAKLKKLSLDTLKQFCSRNLIEFKDDNVEFTMKKLANKIKTIQMKMEVNQEILNPDHSMPPTIIRTSSFSNGMNSGLETLTRKVNDIAMFLSSYEANPALLQQIGLTSLLTKLSSFIFNLTQPAFHGRALSQFVERRQNRVQQRIQSYTALTGSLTAMSLMFVKESLLSCIPPAYYSANLKGCTNAASLQLRIAFTQFLQQLMKMVPAFTPITTEASTTNNRLPPIPLLNSIIQYALLPYDPLHDSALLTQVSLLRFLADVTKQAIRHVHESSQSRIKISTTDTCLFAFTGRTFVEMDQWECTTCNLVNGDLCCAICARICHVGHVVRFKKRGRAFCDCGSNQTLNVTCQCMQHLQQQQQHDSWQNVGRLAMKAYHKFALTCLSWKEETTTHVSELHQLVITTMLRTMIKEVDELYSSPVASIRASPHLGPIPPETAARIDETFLYQLLLLSLKSRVEIVKHGRKLAASEKGASSSSPSSNANLQVWMEFVNALICIIYSASTRLQRVALRLARHLLPIMPMPSYEPFAASFTALALFTSTYRSPAVGASASSSSISTSVANHIVSGMISLVGDLLLRSTPQQQHLKIDPQTHITAAPLASSTEQFHLSASTSVRDTQSRYQVILHASEVNQLNEADASESGARTNPSPQALVQTFVDRFTSDVLDAQRSQLEAEARLNGECKSDVSVDDDDKPSKKLDSIFRRDLHDSLEQHQSGVVFTGYLESCQSLATKMAGSGLVTSITLVKPDEYVLRNQDLNTHKWQPFQAGGKQSLIIASECVQILRTMLRQPDEWSQIIQEQLAFNLQFLDFNQAFTSESVGAPSLSSISSSLPTPLSDSFVSAFSSLLVISGTGFDVPYNGGALCLTSKETGEGSLAANEPIFIVSTDDASVPSTLPNVTPTTLTSPWRQASILNVDDGSSELNVCFMDDSRHAISHAHHSRFRVNTPTHTSEYEWIHLLQSSQAITITKRILQTLQQQTRASTPSNQLHSSESSSREQNWIVSLVESRLLRSLCVLIRRPECAQLLLTSTHAPVFQWIITSAFAPSFFDFRTISFEWARGMERLIDLRLEARQTMMMAGQSSVISTTTSSDASSGLVVHSPTCWNIAKSPFCLLNEDGLYLEYLGGVGAATSRATTVRRVKKQDVMPATFITDYPFLQLKRDPINPPNSTTAPIVYFEVELVSCTDPGFTIGLCPDVNVIHNRRLHGWCEQSFVFSTKGLKGEFRADVRDPMHEPLQVGDLIDCRDSVGKFEPAIIMDVKQHENDQEVRLHYVDWDVRYDETIHLPHPNDATAAPNDRIQPFGTHSKNYPIGQIFYESYGNGVAPAESLQSGDVVGCGWNRAANTIFFTLNSRNLGTAFATSHGHKIPDSLYPAVGLTSAGTKLRINFGAKPFKFKGLDHMQQQQILSMMEEQSKLSTTSTTIHPMGTRETVTTSNESGVVLLSNLDQPVQVSSEGMKLKSDSPDPDSNPSASFDPSRVASRREKAISIMHIGVLPDWTLEQLMQALELNNDEIERAVAYAYEHPRAFQDASSNHHESRLQPPPPPPPASTTTATSTTSPDSQVAIRHRSMGARRQFQVNSPIARVMPSRRRQSGNNYGSDSNDSDNDDDERKIDSGMSRSSSHVRFRVDDEPDQHSHRVSSSSASSSSSAPQEGDSPLLHAYQFNALSGAHNSNDFHVAETQDLLLASEGSRRAISLEASLFGGGSGRSGFGRIDHSQLVDLLSQLQHVDVAAMSNVMLLLAEVLPHTSEAAGRARRAGGRDRDSDMPSIFILPASSVSDEMMSGSPPPPEPKLKAEEIAPGLRVRISRDAKKIMITTPGALSSPNHAPWLSAMDDTVLETGVIKQLDREHGIALVEFIDYERSRKRAFWYPLRALAKIIAMRTSGFLNLNHVAIVHPHLISLQHKSIRHHARQFLQIIGPTLSKLIKNAMTSMNQLTSSSTPLSPSSESLVSSPFLKHLFPSYCRNIFMVSSLRCLEKMLFDQHFASFVVAAEPTQRPSLPMIAPSTPQPFPAGSVESEGAQHLLNYLASHQPQVCLQAFQHAYKLFHDEAMVVSYQNKSLQTKDYLPGGKHYVPPTPSLMSSDASGTVQSNPNLTKIKLPLLWSRAVSVPSSICLGVSFQGKSCLPAGAALRFYGNSQCTRLLYAFTRPRGSSSKPVSLPPFIVNTNHLWLKLTFNPDLANPPSSIAQSPYDEQVSFTFHISPISEQFALACMMSQTLTEQYIQAKKVNDEKQILVASGAAVSSQDQETKSALSSPSSPSQIPSSSKSDVEFLSPLLKQIFTECSSILLLNSTDTPSSLSSSSHVRPPILIRTVMAQFLTFILTVVPRGSLGDLSSLVPIMTEMGALHDADGKASIKLHERESDHDSPVVVLYSKFFQALLELAVAIKGYGSVRMPAAMTNTHSTPIKSLPRPSNYQQETEMKSRSTEEDDVEMLEMAPLTARPGSSSAATAASGYFADNPPPVTPLDHRMLQDSDNEIEEDESLRNLSSLSSSSRSVSQSHSHPDTPRPSFSSEDNSSSSSPLPPHVQATPPAMMAALELEEKREEEEDEHEPALVIHADELESTTATINSLFSNDGAQAERWARMRTNLQTLSYQRSLMHHQQHEPLQRSSTLDEQLLQDAEDIISREIHGGVKRRPSRGSLEGSSSIGQTASNPISVLLHPELIAMPDYVHDMYAIVNQLRSILVVTANDTSSFGVTNSTLSTSWHLPGTHRAYYRHKVGGPSTGPAPAPAVTSPRARGAHLVWNPNEPPLATSQASSTPKGEQPSKQLWTLPAYHQLTRLMNELSDQQNLPPHQIPLTTLPQFDDDFFRNASPTSYNVLIAACHGSMVTLRYHAQCLQQLNVLLFENLTKIDLTNIGGLESTWSTNNSFVVPRNDDSMTGILQLSLADLIERCSGLLFLSSKSVAFHGLLQETALSDNVLIGGSMPMPNVHINRLRASEVYDRSVSSRLQSDRRLDKTALIQDTICGQVFTQLRGVNCATFRRPKSRGATPHVAFQVVMEGETVLGLAGPWKIFFQEICEELLEPKGYRDPFPLALFVPTPNSLHKLGENRGAFLPHPSATSVQEIELYEFVGRLIGIAIRTKVLLSLNFPSLFWKLLTGREPSRDDLRQCDQTLVDSILKPIEACQSEEEFKAKFGYQVMDEDDEDGAAGAVTSVLHFPVTRSDNTIPFPLLNGGTLPVTFATSRLYAKQLEETRLYECAQQIQAIRRGIADIVPLQLLSMFTWSELELLCCGRNEVDIALLRRHTEYASGLSEETEHIQWFWQILEKEFDQKQKAKFVKFTYAQERLPATDAGYGANTGNKIRMLIKPSSVAGDKQDNVLPHAETCFFNLQLPAYSSYEIMKERLLTTLETVDYLMSGDDTMLHDREARPATARPNTAGSSRPTASSSSSFSATSTAAAGGASVSSPSMAPSRISAIDRASLLERTRAQMNLRREALTSPSRQFSLNQSSDTNSSSRASSSTVSAGSTSSATNNSTTSTSFTSFRSLYSQNLLQADRSAIFENFNNSSSTSASTSSSTSSSTTSTSTALVPASTTFSTAVGGPTSSSSASTFRPPTNSQNYNIATSGTFPAANSRAFLSAFAGGPTAFGASNPSASSSSSQQQRLDFHDTLERLEREVDEAEARDAASSSRRSTLGGSSAGNATTTTPSSSASSSSGPLTSISLPGIFQSSSEFVAAMNLIDSSGEIDSLLADHLNEELFESDDDEDDLRVD